jgi:AcrR family transcriptional regulator
MKNAEQSEITKSKILRIALKEFSTKGYAGVSLEEIVEQLDLTRGSLYHHFKGKKGLFQALVESLQNNVAGEVEKAAMLKSDPWESLLAGSMAFIRTMISVENQRILIIDAPTVLGWKLWNEIDDANSESHLLDHLKSMKDSGELQNVSIEALTSVLSGAMNEAVMWVGKQSDTEAAIDEVSLIIKQIIYAFRK